MYCNELLGLIFTRTTILRERDCDKTVLMQPINYVFDTGDKRREMSLNTTPHIIRTLGF